LCGWGMKKIAVYGKGGSGKSTISAALSVTFAKRGMKVLQVGCDPKADSTLVLTDGERIPTLLELLARGLAKPAPEQFIVEGRLGIECVEAGGPPPGAGCGGRGIARMFELFDELDLFVQRDYDIVIFDVLGDVVCGGFAAPLRHGFADRAFVVVSEEPLSLYAANNIIQAVRSYGNNGVRLGGLALNVSDDLLAAKRVEKYASAIGAEIAGIIPRDPKIQLAEFNHRSAVEVEDSPATVLAIQKLADAVIRSFDVESEPPEFLELDDLFNLLSGRAGAPERTARPIASAASPMEDGEATEGDGARQPQRSLPAQGKVVGGPQSRAAFAHMLRLESGARKHHHIEITEALWEDGSLTLTLKSPSLGKLRFSLARAGEGVQAFKEVAGWALSYEGQLSKPGMALVDFIVGRLEQVAPNEELLHRALTLDTQSELLSDSISGQTEAQRKLAPVPRHWCVWGEESHAGLFLFDDERQRKVNASLRLGGSRMLNIHHAGDVCQFSKQRTSAYSTHFIRPPWQAEMPEHEFAEESEWLYTRLGEYHLIAGSNDVLEDVLARTAEGDRDWDAVSIWVSCSPVVSGEDWRGVVREFAKGYDGPILSMGIGDGDSSGDLITVAHETLRKEPPREMAGEGVHFVGFPPARGRNELAELLRKAGIPVQQFHLPDVHVNRLKDYREAAVQLLWPAQEYNRLYRELFEPLPVPAVRIAPPFGVAGTDAFVRQAAEAAGMDSEVALAALAEERTRCEEELARLRPFCAQHRIGVALTARQVELAQQPEKTQGIPFVSLLEELGFQVEVLMNSEEEKRLNWWLRSGLSGVVTDVAHDLRLLDLGVSPVGFSDLEAGYAGAMRSAQRVLNVCSTPFFRDFARYAGTEVAK
jgi:nitrogenase iron protein NifH